MTDGPGRVLRVTQIGNASQGPGGVASVVRTVNSWADEALEVREWPTYWHGSRRRTLASFARTALRVVFGRVSSRDVWHFHLTQQGSFLREGLLLGIARRRGVCCTVLVHGSDFVDFAQDHRRLAGRVLRRAAVVFVLTDPASTVLESLGVSAVKVANAVPVEGEPGPGPRSGFVFAGEVGLRKGADILLSAWADARVDGHELVVFGDLEPRFELPAPLPDGVVVAGRVEPGDVLARLRTAVALVLPSRAEAMPMSILESMSLGTPVIGTDVGQVAEVVGETGLLVPPEDPAALGAAIRRIADSPDTARELGRLARQRVQERYSTDAVKHTFVTRWAACVAGLHPPGTATPDPPPGTREDPA
ncbi:glycosyltransferase [Blastococcus saxobsidens]|uniref:Glycosyltransferase involved in cell wall biosynthesis n=1 Tax=Blastococcus saxobsidens TaxID=138336 RepID=A0A4Q7YBU4_9ACTN|nr:glycosyltransferase [Blastococcus saxobsidens]RZU34104.1 glycosyltransferase involved in cell wall biosynthesis [Blastococcus saxobsidens]